MHLLPRPLTRKLRFKLKDFNHLYKAKLMPRKHGFAKYSVVSACYNVEKYLDAFILSLVRQQLSFKNNIELILVDDGSTDGTLQKCQEWQKRYPKNIKVITKENGGQASARNLGLKYATHEWVNFADPDDFFSYQAFLRVDNCLKEDTNHDLCMVSMHYKFFYENEKKIRDSHPLTYRFAAKKTVRQVARLDGFIQLSTNSVILKKQVIDAQNLQFDERCRPNFEDARFVNTYLSYCQYDKVAFLRGAVYYYRKRADQTSTLDTSWSSKKNFFDIFQYGKLPLLDIAEKLWGEKIPLFIQNTIIYDCYWHVNYGINKEYRIAFLDQEEKTRYVECLRKVYSKIDAESILKFSKTGMASFYYKVGILGCFKNTDVPYQRVYVTDYDPYHDEVKLCYYTFFDPKNEEFFINESSIDARKQQAIPSFVKSAQDTFAGERFVLRRLVWLPLDHASDEAMLICRVNGLRTDISLKNRADMALKIGKIRSQFRRNYIDEKSPYAYCWLISDRDTQADDNAEHFYRWLQHNHPKIKAFFLLNRNSQDWERLQKEGFKLIPYGGKEHREALSNAQHLISSAADDYTVNYFRNDRPPHNKPLFTFLQHGVIQDDLSDWLNRKDIKLFVTSVKPELDSIAGDYTRYRHVTYKEVKLTGLARHDALLKKNNPSKIILIMPSWRHNVVLPAKGMTNARDINPEFTKSLYFKAWQEVLLDPRLKELAERHGYRVIFFPHANIQNHLFLFKIPEFVEVRTHKDTHIQDLFGSGAVMITDYSSVAFDFAYLSKPVIYYQFDFYECFVLHTHTYDSGYFEYPRDGFGPVAYKLDNLFPALQDILEHDCKLAPIYQKRVDNFFVYRDGKNCERIYSAICNLTCRPQC